ERDRVGVELARERHPDGPARGDDRLEAARVRRVDQHLREARIVLDHEQYAVVRRELGAVVPDELFGGERDRDRRFGPRQEVISDSHARPADPAWRGLRLRHVELERAALGGSADDRDLAAEHARDLAADGEAEAGAAVLAAGAAV